jgi:hypothetical protein
MAMMSADSAESFSYQANPNADSARLIAAPLLPDAESRIAASGRWLRLTLIFHGV